MRSKFSVLISLYNKEIPRNFYLALESISNQTLKADQVILVFDGPVNRELENIVSTFQHRLNDFIIVRLENNMGLGNALNFGLKYCEHDIVARMDTDDICYPTRFERQIGYLINNPSVSVLGTTIQEFNTEPNDIGIYRKLPLSSLELIKFAKFRNPLNHPSVIFRKNDVISAGSYIDMPLFEDFYLWIRMLEKNFKIANLEEPLLHFRVGNDMIGRRHGISYLKKELNFLSTIRKSGFINLKVFLLSLMVKLPLRIMPKNILQIIYRKILR